ncbi:MAG TPA: type IV toxin-antitoxin system AbiEi family antitoxin domain-containing protein [Acidimicrobiales bacterium]|nr:type IV toxin-antitoxin system AbiEi family antitoxin domain-containing protein [Acidimicrobiales bacterium]
MDLDWNLRALAERQHGVITRRQAQDLGASRHHVRRRTASPDWEPVTSKVLRLVGTQRTFRQRAMAAALDAGPGAAVSREAAAGSSRSCRPPASRCRCASANLGGEEWIGRVDFLYPEKRVVVEIDSALHHGTLSDEAADGDRDRTLHQAGYRVVRIGEQLVWHRPQQVVRRLLAS